VSELRRALAAMLPEYMVPTAFVFLDDLPQLPNGKVDRRRLPAPGRDRPALDEPYVVPGTPFEREVARIWSETLDVEPVGIHDHFLDLGGHSLLAGQVLTRIVEAFRIELTMPALATSPTVAELAALIVERCAAGADPSRLEGFLGRDDAR
jgi:acyl carrier protein